MRLQAFYVTYRNPPIQSYLLYLAEKSLAKAVESYRLASLGLTQALMIAGTHFFSLNTSLPQRRLHVSWKHGFNHAANFETWCFLSRHQWRCSAIFYDVVFCTCCSTNLPKSASKKQASGQLSTWLCRTKGWSTGCRTCTNEKAS